MNEYCRIFQINGCAHTWLDAYVVICEHMYFSHKLQVLYNFSRIYTLSMRLFLWGFLKKIRLPLVGIRFDCITTNVTHLPSQMGQNSVSVWIESHLANHCLACKSSPATMETIAFNYSDTLASQFLGIKGQPKTLVFSIGQFEWEIPSIPISISKMGPR